MAQDSDRILCTSSSSTVYLVGFLAGKNILDFLLGGNGVLQRQPCVCL